MVKTGLVQDVLFGLVERSGWGLLTCLEQCFAAGYDLYISYSVKTKTCIRLV